MKVINSKTNGLHILKHDAEDNQLALNHHWYSLKCGNVFYAVAANLKQRGSLLYFHRLVMNAQQGEIVDHINGDGMDNRRSNLRVCSNALNVANGRKCNKPTSSTYKGVNWDKEKRKWRATVKSKIVGRFNTQEEAAICYNEFALKEWGEYARLNEIKIN